MRRPLSSSALAVLFSAFCLARAEPPPDAGPAPSKELLDTACTSGLLLQRPDAGTTDAAPDDDAPGGAFADPGLFGASAGGGDDKDNKDAPKPASADKPKPKPKTRLLRPRSDDDKAGCRDKVSALYRDHGGEFSAVPAPANLDTASIEANIDHVFGVTSGPAQQQLLKNLKGPDIAAKTAVVNRIFDGATVNGVTTLNEDVFRTTIASNLHGITAGRAGGVMAGVLPPERQTPDPLAAKADAAAKIAAAAPAPASAYSPPGTGLPGGLPRASTVPDVRPVPPAREAWTGPSVAVPPESGYLRQKWNDYSTVARDVVAGQPITTEMGWAPGVINPMLHNTAPAQLSGVAGVDKMLPAGIPGQSRECGRGVNGSGDYACWGTKDMVAILTSMGQKYDAYFKKIGGTQKIRIGDISRQGGGHLAGHVSHQRGVDVDLRFVGGRGGFNVQANSMIIAALMLSVPNYRNIPGQQMILVDQSLHPAVGAGLNKLVTEGVITADEAARARASLRHWPGHRDHFHLRIKLGDAKVAPQVPGAPPAGDVDDD